VLRWLPGTHPFGSRENPGRAYPGWRGEKIRWEPRQGPGFRVAVGVSPARFRIRAGRVILPPIWKADEEGPPGRQAAKTNPGPNLRKEPAFFFPLMLAFPGGRKARPTPLGLGIGPDRIFPPALGGLAHIPGVDHGGRSGPSVTPKDSFLGGSSVFGRRVLPGRPSRNHLQNWREFNVEKFLPCLLISGNGSNRTGFPLSMQGKAAGITPNLR